MLHRIGTCTAVVLATLLVGCAAMVRDAAREVTPALIVGAVEGLADPETRSQVVEAIDERQVKTMSARLSAGFVDGLLDTLEDPKRRRRLEALISGITATAAGAAVDSMLNHALDEDAQARMQLAMRATVVELITVAFETVASRAGSPEERTQAFGAAAHEIAKQATLGFQEALDDTRRDRASGTLPEEDGALVIAASTASTTGDRILWTLGIGLGAVTLGLILTLIWGIRRNRLRRAELKQRDAALLGLTEAIKSTEAQPGADELRKVLETLSRDLAGRPQKSRRWAWPLRRG